MTPRETYEHYDRQNAIEAAAAELARFLWDWRNPTTTIEQAQEIVNDLYDDLALAVADHFAELRQEAAKERALEGKADQEGKQY